jgi:hypothetical protein
MRSSYNKKDITYGELIQSITRLTNPKKIVEIGILDGYSLESFVKSSTDVTEIYAYDLFEEFNGNHSDKDKLLERFNRFSNVKIEYGDFYKLHNFIHNVDILHIDIANNGDVFEFVMNNYLQSLSPNGIIIFEGGSNDRDSVEWMIKYNKPKINPVIEKYQNKNFDIQIYGIFPSITIIKNKT